MNQVYWDIFLPGIQMPTDCTYKQFVAVREVMWREEDIEFDNAQLHALQALLEAPDRLYDPYLRGQIDESYQFLINQVSDRLVKKLSYV